VTPRTCLSLAALLLPLAAHAEPEAPPSEPVKVKLGVYVLNVGKFDLVTGTYTVDFYLDMTSVPADTDMGDPRFEFINGRAATMDKVIDKPGEKFYRIQANLQTNVDMHRFPWDEHELPIVIEPVSRGKKELVYVVDEAQSGLDPAVSFVGWNLNGAKGLVRDHAYPLYGEEFSQYVYTMKISRLMLMSSLKTFLPVICFLLISLISLMVAVEKLDARVSLNTAMLIAAVMFHMSVAAQLPPAGYLTVADKVMVATYGTIAVNLLFTVQLMRMVQQQREQAARAFRELCFKLVPAIAALAYATAGLTSLF
jgi:hypothetical protein